MNIIYVRATDVKYDPRVQKEVNSLIKDGKNTVVILSWDRSHNGKVDVKEMQLTNGIIKVVYFPIAATWGGGPRKNLKAILGFIKAIKKWIKNISGFNAIHFCELPIAISLLSFARKRKFKIVYDIYDYYPDLRKTNKIIRKLFVMMENRVIKKADAVIICSEERIEQIGKAKYKKMEIIHNAPSVVEFGECCMKSNFDKIKFVYVGNLVEERLISLIIDYFKSNNDYELHIGGIGILENMVKESSEKYDNIFYYGRMIYEDVLALEKQCDLMIALYDPAIPNHRYVAANKFYEALYLGKPLIICKHTGLDKVIDSEKIGVTIEPDLASLSNAIDIIINSKDKWSDIARRENYLFYNHYSWGIMEKRLVELYNNL